MSMDTEFREYNFEPYMQVVALESLGLVVVEGVSRGVRVLSVSKPKQEANQTS